MWNNNYVLSYDQTLIDLDRMKIDDNCGRVPSDTSQDLHDFECIVKNIEKEILNDSCCSSSDHSADDNDYHEYALNSLTHND